MLIKNGMSRFQIFLVILKNGRRRLIQFFLPKNASICIYRNKSFPSNLLFGPKFFTDMYQDEMEHC